MCALAGCFFLLGILIAGMPLIKFIESLRECDDEWSEHTTREPLYHGWINSIVGLLFLGLGVGILIEESSTPIEIKYPLGSRYNPIMLQDTVFVTANREPKTEEPIWQSWFNTNGQAPAIQNDTLINKNIGGAGK